MVIGRKYSLLDERIFDQFKSKLHVFSDSVLCLGEKCPDHPEVARILGNRSNQLFLLEARSIDCSTTSQVNCGIRTEDLRG